METLPVALPQTPAAMVALLLQLATPAQQEAALCRALAWQQAGLRQLEVVRLAHVEQGWESTWRTHYDNKTALVTEITRVLAERFGR